ncbi:MAG: hypothetical protein WC977_05165 [Anaerovoracaceae bacterium]
MAERQLNVIVSAVDRLSKPAASMTKDLKAIEAAGRAAAETLATRMLVASTVVVGAFAACTHAAAQYGDELAKTADKTGMAVEELAALRYAAEQSGVGFDQMRLGLSRMQRAAFDAAHGMKEQADTFALLGVSVQDASGGMRSGQEIFRDVAESIAAMDDPTAQAALAMRVFGRSGAELLPLLKKGGEGIDELMQRAEALGLVMSEEAARDAERFNDAINDLKLSAKGVTVAIGEAMFGTAEYAEKLAVAVGGVSKWIREHKTAVQVIVGVAGFVTTLTIGMYGLNKAVGMVRETMGLVNTVLEWYRARQAAGAAATDAATAAQGRQAAVMNAKLVPALKAVGAAALWAYAALKTYQAVQDMTEKGEDVREKTQRLREYAKATGQSAEFEAARRNVTADDRVRGAAMLGGATAEDAAAMRWMQRESARLRASGTEAEKTKWTKYMVQPDIDREAREMANQMKRGERVSARANEMLGRETAANAAPEAAPEAAQAAATAAADIPSTSSAVAAMPEAAMDLWRSMEKHLSRLADGLVGAPSREGERVPNGMGGVGAVGTRRQVPGAGGPITVQLVMDSRVIAQQVIALERGRAYGYP